jgi:hypothetical protein
MKRSPLDMETIAQWNNLATAFQRAAKSTSNHRPVAEYRQRLEYELSDLQQGLLNGDYPLGRMRCFRIYDPKPREIHAPVFKERVLHHALMAQVGPVLDRALVDDTYACRRGKGTHAAVRRCQQHIRRFPYFVQIDIQAYFASMDHLTLIGLLERKFKDTALLAFLVRVIRAYEHAPGKGLPIGALTSQHFANYYLAGLDRFLSNHAQVRGMVRYMDDVIWFAEDAAQAREQLEAVDRYLCDKLKLRRKTNYRSGRSNRGTLFCGFRILPGAVLLSWRKKRRYHERRKHWEQACLRGDISIRKLQHCMAAVLGMTQLADAVSWRNQQLARHPVPVELELY